MAENYVDFMKILTNEKTWRTLLLYGRKNYVDSVKNLTNEKTCEPWTLFGRGNCGDFMKNEKKDLTMKTVTELTNQFPETENQKLNY